MCWKAKLRFFFICSPNPIWNVVLKMHPKYACLSCDDDFGDKSSRGGAEFTKVNTGCKVISIEGKFVSANRQALCFHDACDLMAHQIFDLQAQGHRCLKFQIKRQVPA